MFQEQTAVKREIQLAKILEEQRQGTRGIINERLSWEDCAIYIRTEQYDKLGRMPEDILVYREFRDKVVEEYETIGDYVAVQVFGLETETNFMSSHKRKAVWPSDFNAGEPMLVFRENDFPYSLEDGIEHHVLWSSSDLSEKAIRDVIAKERDGFESIFFINPPEYKSVHSIQHAHILSRKSFSMKHSSRVCPLFLAAGLFQSCTFTK
mmetsp:Transcript_3857/g.7966  ORF Transcript_3857/g.7966 Transcript_3857/m.7966 type:complete len:208 (-) Transcript_3857:276-899(-)